MVNRYTSPLTYTQGRQKGGSGGIEVPGRRVFTPGASPGCDGPAYTFFSNNILNLSSFTLLLCRDTYVSILAYGVSILLIGSKIALTYSSNHKLRSIAGSSNRNEDL